MVRLLNRTVKQRTVELQTALDTLTGEIEERKRAEQEVHQLRGMLPICSSCKKVRDDQGYWNQIEGYIKSRFDTEVTHGICPDCYARLYPELAEARDVDEDRPGD